MTHSEIIEALGGHHRVAEITGDKVGSVIMWKTRGIPFKRRPQLARAAKERKIMLPADFLVPLS